jgi:hypothetical protein
MFSSKPTLGLFLQPLRQGDRIRSQPERPLWVKLGNRVDRSEGPLTSRLWKFGQRQLCARKATLAEGSEAEMFTTPSQMNVA